MKVILGFHNIRFHEKPLCQLLSVNNGTGDSYWGGKFSRQNVKSLGSLAQRDFINWNKVDIGFLAQKCQANLAFLNSE